MDPGEVSGVRLTPTAVAPCWTLQVLSHVELQQLERLVKLQGWRPVRTLGTVHGQDVGAGKTLAYE